MLCTRHHGLYDAHDLDIEELTPQQGADGLLRYTLGSAVYEEQAA